MKPDDSYDVVIIGGALSGAAAAVLLRRDQPGLRVLVVEKSARFDEKVGEATTEMSAMFLTRRLALWQHLELNHLPKEGLRYWFHNERVTGHANASEMGGVLRSTVPSFQLRRDVLDEHLLGLAREEGAEVLRPARVLQVDLGEFDSRIEIESEGSRSTVRCRWVLDATGRAQFLARRLGIVERLEEHPVAAMWARWRNVRHIDDLLARSHPEIARRNVGSRRLGTNHYTGLGYWIWVIPLGHGETSVGIVFDRRLVSLHTSRNREEDYRTFLESHPALAELLEGAELRTDDLRYFSHLPYFARQYMGNGWALLGDAASFLDPYYSPGLDHAAFTVEATCDIVRRHHLEEDIRERMKEHNDAFARSYRRFFEAVYRDKYFYMGEHDLLSAATLIDTAQYYIFVVIPAYRLLGRFHWMPVLGPKPALISYWLMRLYNRRFTRLARLRHAMGRAARRNDGRRINVYFDLQFAPYRMIARGLRLWALAEVGGLKLILKRWLRGMRGRDETALETPVERRDALP